MSEYESAAIAFISEQQLAFLFLRLTQPRSSGSGFLGGERRFSFFSMFSEKAGAKAPVLR